MSTLCICRICLTQGVKMYERNQYNLKQYYEEVMGKKMNEYNGLPHHFCYECAAMLHKFHKFKEKCYTGERELQKMKWKGLINSSLISLAHSQNKNLQSRLSPVVISKRIRTCIVKHKSISKKRVKQNKNGDLQEIEEHVISSDCDSDKSLEDKNLAEIKNEMVNVNNDSIKDEAIDKHNTTEEQNINTIKNVNKNDKAMPNFEDNSRLSDDDEFNTATADEQQTTIQEEVIVIIDAEEINNDDKKKDNIKNETHKKQKGKKEKKFVIRDSTTYYTYLDPKHWLTINLSEEEALEEFNAKAQDKRYLTAAYHCTDCYKGFSKEDMLNRHFKLRHCESLGPVECRFCKMRFKMKCYLTKHLPQHYFKYKCLRCNMMCPLLTTAQFHNAYHNGVIRQCNYCGEEFRHPSTYYTHLRTHRSEHVCTLCGASFVSVAGLNQHRRTMHVNTVANPEEAVNTYCERCDMKFETQKAYEEHVFHSAKHTEAVENVAGDTSGRSKRRRKLITPCPICNEIFPSFKAFVKHRIAKHRGQRLPKQEERCICEICGASLALNSVPSHLNTHTQEKVFNCPTCPMQFPTKSSLKRHQVTHTGEKPYKCTLCDKRFTQKVSMNLHYRTFHLKEPYPKRNRRKQTDIQPDMEDFRISGGDNSEENLKFDRWR